MPFFPRILVGLVGLQHLVVQRHEVAVAEGQILESVPQVQEFRAVATQLAGQLGGGDALGEATDDQDQFAGPPLDAVQGRAGEGVEDPTAVAAAEVQDRVAAPTVDDHAVVVDGSGGRPSRRDAATDELGVARLFIHQVGDREIHGGLRIGTMWMSSHPSIPRPHLAVNYHTPLGLHEPKLHEQIDEAIRVYETLLLVLSPESMASEWVRTEIRNPRKAEGREKRRKLFAIRLVDFETIKDWECFDVDIGKDLGVEMREYFIPDFSNWKDHDAFETAFARLLKDLRAEESTGAKQA